ncbi:uncharacterized protein LOC130897298 [Diorhabda carinulata]|uniref:uncharacterized protein LOC130897298 n=1 Tax=Diorhabda carinulata TaxID=1163345 RepID=UPI0025A036B2|nr:uncharacterized protein LOC130897298 [Diorhabda carinulata]
MKVYRVLKKSAECLAVMIITIDTTTMFFGYYDVVPLWCPVNSSSPFKEIVYVYNIIALTYITTTYIYIQLVCSAVFMFIGMQCDLYCKCLSRVERLDGVLLKNLVQRYENIIRIFVLSERVFSEIFLVEIIFVTLGLCLRLFVISMTENFLELPIHISSLILASLLILLPCWFSTTVKTKSDRISTAVYSLPWYNCQSLRVKKDLVQFIRITERPIEFTGMGLVTLSTDTFINMMRTTFSFYTFLDFLNQRE